MENIMEVAAQYALPAAAATVGAMYFDAKHHVVKDIRDWRTKRKFQSIAAEGAKLMGDYFTIYRILELNDPKAEGFWFENRSWTFSEIIREADRLAQWFIDQGIRTKGFFTPSVLLTVRFRCGLHDELGGVLFRRHGVIETWCNQRNDQLIFERYAFFLHLS
jgi:hypothetical protein